MHHRNTIYVCSLAELPRHVLALQPSHLVSLVRPAEQPPTPVSVVAGGHLRLEIDDIEEPVPEHILPESAHVKALIEFVRAWDGERPMLIHCLAGISRSTAAAFVALGVKSRRSEHDIAFRLRRLAPHARPNRRIVALADRLLRRAGRLVSARDAMGPALPLTEGPLICVSIP